jgi:RNA polymerase sigma factor (sigma-70 family)
MRTVAALCRELTTDHRHDGELLAAFLSGPSEEAFTELVRRHGPLVWGTCRRVLPDPADAEDAFQTAFLVLVQRASRLTRVSALGPWLHRVAVWTARNTQRKNARRRTRQTALPDHVIDPAAAPDPGLKADLDSALLALPSHYRDPIVLCHLLGLSRREAAERLGCPEGTLSAWLNRGLAKLRSRLRGLDPTSVLTTATVAVPAALSANTARAAVATIAAEGTQPIVVSLVEGVLHMFWMKKATAVTVALCATFALGLGVGLSTRTQQTGAGAQDKPLTSAPPTLEVTPEVAKELAKLQDRLDAATARHQAALLSAKAAGDAATAERFQKEAEVAAAEAKQLKDKLDTLKSGRVKLPAQQPRPETGPKPDTGTDKLRRIEDELAKLKAESAAAEARVADALRQSEAMAKKARDLADQAEQLKAERDELLRRLATGERLHPYLEVTLTGNEALWPCRMKEFGPEGKSLGSVIVEDLSVLPVLLTRAAKDPNGPKEVRVVTHKGVPAERVRAVLDACKRAEFPKVILREQAPQKTREGAPEIGKTQYPEQEPGPDMTFQNKEDLERYLRGLAEKYPVPRKN